MNLLAWLSGEFHPKTIWSDVIDCIFQYKLTGNKLKSIVNINDFICFLSIVKEIYDYAICNSLIHIKKKSLHPEDRLLQWLDQLVTKGLETIGYS